MIAARMVARLTGLSPAAGGVSSRRRRPRMSAPLRRTDARALRPFGHRSSTTVDAFVRMGSVHDPAADRGHTCQELFVQVDTGAGPARGATLVDRWGVGDHPANARWATDVDGDRFTSFLMQRRGALAAQVVRQRAGYQPRA